MVKEPFPQDRCALFFRSIHFLLCLTVLACPAWGGECCGQVDSIGAIAVECDHCCSVCEQDNSVPKESPQPCHGGPLHDGPCHDCFCSGALSSSFNPAVIALDWSLLPSIFEAATTELPIAKTVSSYWLRSQTAKPSIGQSLRISISTFLL